MNNIFKVIWNHATQTWTAVGELASAKGKSKSVKLAVISTALFSAGVYAADHKAADDLIAISHAEATVPADEKPQALGNNAIAVGRKAKAETNNSVAIGPSAEVLRQLPTDFNSNGIAIGAQARIEPKVNGNAESDTFHNSIAIGTRTLATASHAIVIGRDASSMRNQNSATYQSGENIIAIGNRARADWEKSIAIGTNSSTVSPEAIAVGTNSMASGGGNKGGVAIGSIAHANHVGTVALGSGSNASNINGMAMGFNASSVGQNTVTVGPNAFSKGNNAVTIGDGAMSGWWSANRAVAVGANAHTVTDDGLSVGYNAFAGNFRSTAIGKNAVSYGAQALALGSADAGGGVNNASPGAAYQKSTMAIGTNSSALGTNSIATGNNNIAFGTGATAGVAQASVDGIKTAYADYRKAYETYANLDKTAENAKANASALKTIVADLSTNLRIFRDNYETDGVLYKHAAEFKAALTTAGHSFEELETLTNEFARAVDTSDGNIAKVLAKKADIEKIANIKNTEVGGQNERLAHLVALAKNLSNKITELEKANTESAAAAKAFSDGKAAHDAAKTAFEKSYAGATDAIAIGASAEAAAKNTIALGARNIVHSSNSGAFGVDNKIYSQNAYVLGNHVIVEQNYNNAVVLGAKSNGTPEVKKVNSANVNGLVYAGFEGNFGGTSKDGTVETIDNDSKGRFVSVGSATTEENGKKVYGERQIKHVAAGEISSTSTDAINGSQLYAVASGLRDAFPVVYTDADGNKVVKYPDGKYYPEGTTFDANGTPNKPAVTNVIASMNNPTNTEAGKAGNNVTLTNVAPGANTYEFDKDGNPLVKIGDKYYAQDNVENGVPKNPDETKTPATEAEKQPYEKAATGLANLKGSKDSNALTVADAKKMGWVVSANGNDYADNVTNAREVRFNGKNGIKVTGNTDDETGVRNINIELEKSDVVKEGEYKIGDKTYVNVDGKLYNKDDIDPKTGKEKPNTKPSDYTVDNNGNVTNTAKPTETVAVDKGDNFVNGNTVYKAIQESGWTVGKAKDALSNDKFKNEDEKVNPNDEVRFADGKGITVKTATIDEINTKGEKQTTTVVKFDTDLPINYANVKNAAGDNLKQANDGKWYKEADVNADGTLKPTDGKAPEAQTPVKTGATLVDGKPNATPYKNEDVYTYTTDPATGEVKATPKAYDAAKPENKDSIVKGKDGVQLNNVGWAEKPDQAVNKDQLDQTVNKSGFFVQQNGKTTVENAANKDETDPAKSEKVTPNDVVNFKNGNGTVINAVTKRDANGVDTTTVSVDVDTSKLDLSDAVDYKAEENTGITVNTTAPQNGGKTTVTVGNKYFKTNADGEEAKVEADAPKGSVAIGSGAKAGKAHTGAYSLDPSATVAGQPSDTTRVVSVGSKGNEAQIQNVAAGVVSKDSTDAVNGSQLHATNVQVNNNTQNINRVEGKVNNLSQVINNHAGELNRLDRKVNKYGKEARAGIAGANAAAALPQVYTPGKSMVAASAGTFKGQNALAVGYSRASDNGKVILKLQGNANTSGDVGAGVGVGYQW